MIYNEKHYTHIRKNHREIKAELDYQSGPCSHCKGKMSKYDFQRESTTPLLETQGMPTVLKLKKRRFQCKECLRVVVSETSLVRKNCQISQVIWKKVTDLHIKNFTNTTIARQLNISVSAAQRQLERFSFQKYCLSINSLETRGNWLSSPKILRARKS